MKTVTSMNLFLTFALLLSAVPEATSFSPTKFVSSAGPISIRSGFASLSPLFRKDHSVLLETTGGAAAEPLPDEPAAVALTSEDNQFLRNFLVVEMAMVKKQIAANWGFILLGGSASLLAGSYLLSHLVLGTEIALLTTICTLLVVGFSNLMISFCAEQGHKLPGILVGATQLGLGYLYATEPAWLTAAAMTLGLCAVITTEGVYRVMLALQNRKMDGYWATLISGLASIAGSAWAVKSLVISSLIVPGLALGLGLISGGLSRIVVSMYGRNYAIQALES